MACLLLCGCTGNFGSPFSWDAAQVNRQNIAVSAERPEDLAAGRDATGGDGAGAAAAIERLRRGRPRPLLDVATSSLPNGTAAPGSAGAGGGAVAAGGSAAAPDTAGEAEAAAAAAVPAATGAD